jgi:hypothetical protein
VHEVRTLRIRITSAPTCPQRVVVQRRLGDTWQSVRKEELRSSVGWKQILGLDCLGESYLC